ncbi:retrotransposon protein, putative, ty1-copia subclass [Tanacetum coccineum]
MENSKRGSIPMKEKLRLSKSQGASTPTELKGMQNLSYASAVGSIMVSCYTDVGYLTDVNDLKSQTGYVFVLNEEAEYFAAYDAFKDAVGSNAILKMMVIKAIIGRDAASTTLVFKKEFVPPLDMCRMIPLAPLQN